MAGALGAVSRPLLDAVELEEQDLASASRQVSSCTHPRSSASPDLDATTPRAGCLRDGDGQDAVVEIGVDAVVVDLAREQDVVAEALHAA